MSTRYVMRAKHWPPGPPGSPGPPEPPGSPGPPWPPDHSSHTDHSDHLKYIDHLDTLDHLDHLDHLDLFLVLAGTIDESIKHTQFHNKNGQLRFLNSKFKPHRLHSLVSHFFPATFQQKKFTILYSLTLKMRHPKPIDLDNLFENSFDNLFDRYLMICLTFDLDNFFDRCLIWVFSFSPPHYRHQVLMHKSSFSFISFLLDIKLWVIDR